MYVAKGKPMVQIFNPRQMVLITCRGSTAVLGKSRDTQDIVATSWHSPASSEPGLYAVFLSKHQDFALSLIRDSRVFCVNFIPYSLHGAAAFCARHAGDHLDKFKETELTASECEKIDCVRVSEAVGHLECELAEEKDVGDHVLLLGNVLFSNLADPQSPRLFQKDKDTFTTTKE